MIISQCPTSGQCKAQLFKDNCDDDDDDDDDDGHHNEHHHHHHEYFPVDNFRPVQSSIGRKVSLVETRPRGSGAG